MKRHLWFLLVLACFLVNVTNAQNTSPTIKLSTYQLEIPAETCERISEAEIFARMQVSVTVSGVSGDIKKSDYKYTVSGGQIVGEGNNLRWNLFGVKAGNYTINLEIVENGKSKAINQSIIVTNAPICCGLCECAMFSLSSTHLEVKQGESVRISLNLNGGSQEEVRIKWTVKGGKIIQGQETNRIIVEADSGSENNLTATVEISGLCLYCPDTESLTIKIKQK